MKKITKTFSAGGFVFNTKGELLFVKEFDKYWGLPRGHVENNETTLQAAIREIKEETGITELNYCLDLGTYTRSTFNEFGQPNGYELKNMTFFYFQTIQNELSLQDPDITDAGWFEVAVAKAKLTNEDDINFFNKSIIKIRDFNRQ